MKRLAVFIFLIGVSFLAYAYIGPWLGASASARLIYYYSRAVSVSDSSDFSESYEDVLDPCGNGMIGYLDIPAIDIRLPIYHGTSEAALQVGVGHLPWSDLPVGGEGTHCVLVGHSGLPSSRLFTDLHMLVLGDRFSIYVLNMSLTYEVDQVETVLSDDLSLLKTETGADLITLVTCTPVGINSHRLLVRGHRVS